MDIGVALTVNGVAQAGGADFYFTATISVRDPATQQVRPAHQGEVSVLIRFLAWGPLPNPTLNTVDTPEGGVTYLGGWTVAGTDYLDFEVAATHKASGDVMTRAVRCYSNGNWVLI